MIYTKHGINLIWKPIIFPIFENENHGLNNKTLMN